MTRATKATQTPTARSVIAYVDRYLMYSLDEDAKNAFTFALKEATKNGESLPEAIKSICNGYLSIKVDFCRMHRSYTCGHA